ncbi:hypothetical protein HDV00_012828 [Rhizophlyctis rosea]|nr:hypothetical protein HDV00_012828 [Rhizophlyctis rosea]
MSRITRRALTRIDAPSLGPKPLTTTRLYSTSSQSTPSRPDDVDTRTSRTPSSTISSSSTTSKTVHFKPLHSETSQYLTQRVHRDLTTTYISPTARVYGSVTIGSLSSIFSHATVKGDVHDVKLGSKVSIHESAVVAPTPRRGVHVGDGVTIGAGTVVKGAEIAEAVVIGDRVVVGEGARIGAGSVVEDGAVVTAGSEIEDGSFVSGSPARRVREVSQEERQRIGEQADLWVRVSRDHRLLLEKEYATQGRKGDAHEAF